MKLSRDFMLERARARDATYDGRFLTGVLSTGIYCLPSCSARAPHERNVVHFATVEEAKAAGLRACRRCRPDDFYRGHDPDLERAVRVTRAIRERPAEFADAGAIAAEGGVSITKTHALFREHFQATPAAFLAAARVRAACRALLETKRRVLDIGYDVGFESASAFHENFRKRTGLSPGDYRRLELGQPFRLALPPDFRGGDTLRYFGRDPESVCERVKGRTMQRAASVLDTPCVLTIEIVADHARCRVDAPAPLDAAGMRVAHEQIARLLNLGCDPATFERRVARERGMGRLVRGRRGLRMPLTADPFESVAWSILGQQVNLAFASAMRRRVAQLCGSQVAPGFYAHPTAEQVARLDYADLRPLQVSQRKAEYLIDTARLIHSGELPLEELALGAAGPLRARLLALRGIGPWSADYVLMRGCGFADCVPVGDAGLVAALRHFFALPARPDPEATRALMQRFAPWRSLATFHFWQYLRDLREQA